MVSDDVASRAVWLGADGVLAGDPAPGALAIECSTLSHDWVLELSAVVAAQQPALPRLPGDRPAGRGRGRTADPARRAATPADVETAEPLLRPLSVDRVHFGPVGAGTAYKLVINLMGAVQIAAAAEGMAMAERAGLDLELVAATIAAGQAASPQVVRNTRRMVAGDHGTDVVFSGNLRRKDAAYGVRLAETLGVGAPFGRVALDGLDALVAAGLGDQNESSIIEVARRAE